LGCAAILSNVAVADQGNLIRGSLSPRTHPIASIIAEENIRRYFIGSIASSVNHHFTEFAGGGAAIDLTRKSVDPIP
jgi:hypothetical protein